MPRLERLQISGKDLGALAMPEPCPRCFWIQYHAPSGLPFQIFPGIFSSIDSYTKRVIHAWFDRHGCPPGWLDGLGPIAACLKPPHHFKFRMLDEKSNVLLTGAPDGIFLRADGSHLIVDYKTSRYTGTQDSLFPLYEAQLNSYAVIAQESGFSPVSGLALVYLEPITDQETASEDKVHLSEGFLMGFSARVLPVALDPGIIRRLLDRAREILDQPRPPAGREGCEECLKLDGLLRLVGG